MRIVKYLYDFSNGKKPFATVVATGKNRIGVSICNKCDTFTKARGRDIATARARSAQEGEVVGLPATEEGLVVGGYIRRSNRAKQSRADALVEAICLVAEQSQRRFLTQGQTVEFDYPQHGSGPYVHRVGTVSAVEPKSILVETPEGPKRFNKQFIKDLRNV